MIGVRTLGTPSRSTRILRCSNCGSLKASSIVLIGSAGTPGPSRFFKRSALEKDAVALLSNGTIRSGFSTRFRILDKKYQIVNVSIQTGFGCSA